MSGDDLRYDRMVEDALRSVVGRALSHAAEEGLTGNHHFYITFRTDHPGVEIPDHLHKRYPDEMTIVLQYQFWGLEVGEDVFSVTLSFADVPERLTVPFEAVVSFADPSVRFGLQFDVGRDEAAATGNDAGQGGTDAANAQSEEGAGSAETEPAEARDDAEAPLEEVSGKVVTLDRFRKK